MPLPNSLLDLSAIRQRFQHGLMVWLNGSEAASGGLNRMRAVLGAVALVQPAEHAAFWRTAEQLLLIWVQRSAQASASARLLVDKLEMQICKLADGKTTIDPALQAEIVSLLASPEALVETPLSVKTASPAIAEHIAPQPPPTPDDQSRPTAISEEKIDSPTNPVKLVKRLPSMSAPAIKIMSYLAELKIQRPSMPSVPVDEEVLSPKDPSVTDSAITRKGSAVLIPDPILDPIQNPVQESLTGAPPPLPAPPSYPGLSWEAQLLARVTRDLVQLANSLSLTELAEQASHLNQLATQADERIIKGELHDDLLLVVQSMQNQVVAVTMGKRPSPDPGINELIQKLEARLPAFRQA